MFFFGNDKTIFGDKRANSAQSRKQMSPEIIFPVAENRFHLKLGFESGDFKFFKFSCENN